MSFDYSQINFEHIRMVAYRYLSFFKVNSFPIRVVPFFNQFDNLILIPYEKAAASENISIAELKDKVTHSDDAATLKRANKYFIFYNDNTLEKTTERIRYSIIHELGHIALNHFQDNRTLLTRSAMSDDEYEKLEVEANFFAAEFLSPKALISPRWGVKEIQAVFRVSKDSATKTQQFISRNSWFQDKSYSEIEEEQCEFYFSEPLDTLIPPCCTIKQAFSTIGFSFCGNCQSFTRVSPHQGDIFCCVCGKQLKNTFFNDSHLFTIYDSEVRNLRTYTSVKLNSNGKAMECPKCHAIQNEEGEYCDICGAYLINRCTSHLETGFSYNNLGEPCENGKILGGRSRYCRFCGCMSTFYEQGILPSYSEEMSKEKLSSSATDEVAQQPF
ncbi:ImmA/IrrE family metallo-endopeptidase [Limosilactobacillus antri]|uniref:ImmA/IrrE family metallo-endopeptidase n=1 Tax=Limosilactobacillus antri TaxID=227943 RepID=UPI001F58F641|nr:ImmA/IrrE family metallo-endopeptidase [Limosilactobacillus antri]